MNTNKSQKLPGYFPDFLKKQAYDSQRKFRWVKPFYLLLLCLLSGFLISCDPTFEPLETNDEFFFSMFGVIDASADTQWVRITPVREQVDMLSNEIEARVTLTNTETGREIIMTDSLFQEDRNFLNFWTAESIDHNQTYRLTAELPTREKSEVTVTTPHEMPLPKISVRATNNPFAPTEYFVLVDENENIADIQVKYYVHILAPNYKAERTFSFSYRNLAEITEDFPGFYMVQIKPEEEINKIERQVLLPPEGDIEVIYRQVYVATSSVEWNEEIESLDDITYALPQTLRNITNGLGYVMGIDSKYIPYEACVGDQGLIVSCGAEKPFW